jgi:hypothetical protein
MTAAHDELLGEVEAFLCHTGMYPTVFGREAIGDPRFVFDLREGRECRRATRQRVREWMQRHRAEKGAAA